MFTDAIKNTCGGLVLPPIQVFGGDLGGLIFQGFRIRSKEIPMISLPERWEGQLYEWSRETLARDKRELVRKYPSISKGENQTQGALPAAPPPLSPRSVRQSPTPASSPGHPQPPFHPPPSPPHAPGS